MTKEGQGLDINAETAEYAARITYRGGRPAPKEEAKMKTSRPYYVRLKFGGLSKDDQCVLFEMAKKLVEYCSVAIGNEGLDVQFKSLDVANIFARGLSVA